MIHRHHIRFAVRNIFFAKYFYARQRTEDSTEYKLGNGPGDLKSKRRMIGVIHLTRASTCSKTSSAVSLSESSTTASSAAFSGATSRVESMRSRSTTLLRIAS